LEDFGVVIEVGVLKELFPMRETEAFEGVVNSMEEAAYSLFGVGEIAERFQRAVEGVVVAGGVKLLGELLDARRFARLAGGVDEEVLLVVNEALEFRQAGGGGEGVVVVGVAGAGDVEEFCHGSVFLFSVSRFRDKDKEKPFPLRATRSKPPVTGAATVSKTPEGCVTGAEGGVTGVFS
jgi:hypothetical protein